MLSKVKKISTYLLATLIFNVAYGVALYFVFTWLSGYSLLHAYIGNLVLIMLILAVDEYTQKVLQSEKFIIQQKKEKGWEDRYRSLEWGLTSAVSFKADLYLFYVIILVFSQVTEFRPSLVGENIGNFIRANDYSILLLVAFDTLINQVLKDREKMKKVLERLKKSLIDDQD